MDGPTHQSEKGVPVMRPMFVRRLALGLGCLSSLSIILAHLALTDIYHGEADLSLEWHAVQAAFCMIIAFHVAAIAALIQFRSR